jgi:hypothetical protein
VDSVQVAAAQAASVNSYMVLQVEMRGDTVARRPGPLAALLLVIVVAAGCTGSGGKSGASSTPTGSSPAASPSGSASSTPTVVRYPGSPYVIVDDICPRVAYQATVPTVYEAFSRVVATDIDIRTNGTQMNCSLLFKRATAGKMGGGSVHLNAWVYMQPADAAKDYEQERNQDRTGNHAPNAQVRDTPGLGQRANEEYVPFEPSTDPHVRIQPARRMQLRVLDTNLIILVSVYASLDWNEPFQSSDAQFQQSIRDMVRQTMAALRS